ncbi:hypothetical protein [Rhodococcus sp. BP22]|uniref:hypothetical protein n=1 Tax=Rhodococcus sp. BP22 TaxID=2758566 RepID=UPI0016477B5A|nr:hypothetical protein [Rhodococcus sp. BP22]
MRLWSPVTGKFAAKGQNWTKRLPSAPAAVPIYKRDRTSVLALDFDAKHHTRAQVDADVARAVRWLHECGARTVTDRSTSGGRHVLVPLATDTPLRVDDIRLLMELLAALLVTLDCTPMLNASTGCITPPGSPCREGGHRQLDGSLDDAVDAFTLRSERGVVARLVAMLGGVSQSRHRTPVAAVAASLIQDGRLVGAGRDRRLHPQFLRRTPTPAAVETYAATGTLDTARWPTTSEARQSVIIHAVLRGASSTDIEAALATPEWAGVARAYTRYGNDAVKALDRDVGKALIWVARTAHQFHQPAHENKHTGGNGSFLNDGVRRAWLANAQLWIDSEFLGTRNRPVLLAVVQALAYTSALAGELVEGIPVVAVGGRSLSHAAGLMSERTVWSALQVLRETPGSPVLLVKRGVGREADRYALTTPAISRRADRVRTDRARVEPVHRAWSVLGLRGRAVYDLVVAIQASTVDDVLAGAKLRPSNGYAIVADLIAVGLITRNGTILKVGSRSLDDVAAAHGLKSVAADRIVRHRAERLLWQMWLETRFAPMPPDEVAGEYAVDWSTTASVPSFDARDSERLWAAQMAACSSPLYTTLNPPYTTMMAKPPPAATPSKPPAGSTTQESATRISSSQREQDESTHPRPVS